MAVSSRDCKPSIALIRQKIFQIVGQIKEEEEEEKEKKRE